MGGEILKRLVILIICISLLTTPAFSKQNKIKHYWIDKGVPLLVFIGDPHSLDLQMVRMTTYEKQEIKLFHKKSGPGLYAFYLPGLVYKDDFGNKQTITKNGWFIAKKRLVRGTEYKIKQSMKKKTFNYERIVK